MQEKSLECKCKPQNLGQKNELNPILSVVQLNLSISGHLFPFLVLQMMMYMKKAMGIICNSVQKLEHFLLYL